MVESALLPFAEGWWIARSATYATNSGLFAHSDELCLIDPGITPQEVARLSRFVRERGWRPVYLVLTHAHWDHLLGASAFPATVVARRSYAEVVDAHEADLRRQVQRWAAEEGLTLSFTPPRPVLTFGQTMRLHIGCRTLRLLATPGHSKDHLSLFDGETGVLWAGDMLSDRELPYVQYDAAAYLSSLERLQTLQAAYLVPGHGLPTAERAEIEARFERDRAYLQQLMACVEEALRAGETVEGAVRRCDFTLPLEDAVNRTAHRWNVETLYSQRAADFGLSVEPGLGWAREWRGECL